MNLSPLITLNYEGVKNALLRNTTLIHISVVVASLFIIPAHTKIYYNQIMRINKYIASCTSLSRRKAEELISTGKIRVNDKIVRDLSAQIQSSDKVYLSSSVIPARQRSGKHPAGIQKTKGEFILLTPQEFVYYALNKPVGYTTTTADPHAEKLITDLVPKDPPVFPVGRLDKDTSGLIFLTNDGDFAQKMTHPKYEKEKEYIVETDKPLSEKSLVKLRTGIKLDDGTTAPAKVTPLCHSLEGGNPVKRESSQKKLHKEFNCLNKPNCYSITIHEGRNRQIRRMINAAGAKVMKLKRIRIGNFDLGDLKEGKYKNFDKIEQ